MVIALAGRRIDAADAAEARFPPDNAPLVRRRLQEIFVELGARVLVCSAACGADLIALDVAGNLKMRRRVILPFDVPRFRETSVTDRPGQWGEPFDRIVADLAAAGDLRIVGSDSGEAAYEATNQVILDEVDALRAQLGSPAAAVIVWNGRSRGPDDLTAQFRDLAKGRGLHVYEVSTL